MKYEGLRRKEFERMLNALPSDFTSNVWDLLEQCLQRGIIVQNVLSIEKIKYDIYHLSLIEGQEIDFKIPNWYGYWPSKIREGWPKEKIFTIQEILQEIQIVNEIEDEMFQGLINGTKIENFIAYCEAHKDEEVPHWVHGLLPGIHYGIDPFLQTLWEESQKGLIPKLIISTDQICIEDEPYFVQKTIPEWMTNLFNALPTLYHCEEQWPLTWGKLSTLIK